MEILIVIMITAILAFTNSQQCGSPKPQNFKDCNVSTNEKNVCCFANVSLNDSYKELCAYVPLNQTFITPYITQLDIGLNDQKINVRMDCGVTETSIKPNSTFSNCGHSPKSLEDCKKNSLENASCCFIQNPDNFTTCILNNGVYQKNESYFGISVLCTGQWKQFNAYMLFFVLGIIIFL